MRENVNAAAEKRAARVRMFIKALEMQKSA